MSRTLKNVFLMLACTIVALLLYFIFFGVDLPAYGKWEGLIWFSARAIEQPISRYYYEYCYLPNIHSSDYVDEALGGTPVYTDLYDTPANLAGDVELYNFSGVTDFYSTGWYY